ncbi:MAG: histidine phosphatase family protein [Syntrophobacterales bacterium]|nr:histidine phosphatase family protein [Syntrophobacterales bacterium]
MRVAAMDPRLVPTRLYLIRHGRVADGHTDRYHGHNDVDLSPEGLRQYERLAAHLQDVPLTAVYSSDLTRTRLGAQMLAAGRDLTPLPCPEFRELCFGVWEGLTLTEIQAYYPQELAARFRDLANFRIPGGESLTDVQARVLPKLRELLRRHPGQSLALVAHAGVNRVILCDALNLPLEHLFRLDQAYGCLNIIDYFPDFTLVRLINGGVNGAG